MMTEMQNESVQKNTINTEWFDKIVGQIRYDQTMIEHDLIEAEKKSIYEALTSENIEKIAPLMREMSYTYYVSSMIEDYIRGLLSESRGSKPKKLALEISNNKILIWIEILQDDEQMEDAIIITETRINRKYKNSGFSVSSTIVEENDKLSIPTHYKEVPVA